MDDSSLFQICLISKGGWITGYFPDGGSLTSAPGQTLPSWSSSKFMLWQFGEWSGTSQTTWDTYFKGSGRNVRGQLTVVGINNLLTAAGATSEANGVEMCEIQLKDQYGNPVPSPSLVMKAWRDGGTFVWKLYRKEVSGSTVTYTGLSDARGVSDGGQRYTTHLYVVCSKFVLDTYLSYGLGVITYQTDNNYGGPMVNTFGEIAVLKSADFPGLLMGATPEEKEANPDLGPASEPEGYGPGTGGPIGGIGGPGPSFDFTSDPFELSPLPPGISELGFINIYKCGIGALGALGATLFPDVSAATDVMTAITAMSDAIWNSKLIDYVISIHMIPANVPAGADEDIKIGTRTLTGIQGAKVSSDYVEVNLGTLKIDEAYTSFVDYKSRCRLYLPFYGYVELKPEYWQSATLSIKYRFNVVDGSFVATVMSRVERHQPTMEAMVGQFSGSACIHCPASGVSYASMFGGMVSNSAGMGVSMASGNVAGVASSALNMAQSSQGQMQSSNPYNASASIMGHRKPYLLIERPISNYPTRYAKEKGYPLYTTMTIGSCRGFTIAEDIQLNGIACTEAEKEKIRQAFQRGVIIKS